MAGFLFPGNKSTTDQDSRILSKRIMLYFSVLDYTGSALMGMAENTRHILLITHFKNRCIKEFGQRYCGTKVYKFYLSGG